MAGEGHGRAVAAALSGLKNRQHMYYTCTCSGRVHAHAYGSRSVLAEAHDAGGRRERSHSGAKEASEAMKSKESG